MTTKLIALASWLALAVNPACVSDDTQELPIDDTARPLTEDVQLRAFAQPELPEDTSPDGCEATVATDGACSIACNPDAVIDQYVPAGTCAVFQCELESGQLLPIGGCNL